MKYFIFTLGCQMNESDSERIISVLEKLGYKSAEDESKADLILANLCSVRQSAIDRIWGRTKIWNSFKKKKPNLIVGLTGCILEKDKKRFQKNSAIDFIFDIKDLSKLPKILSDKKSALRNKKNKLDRLSPIANYFDIHPKYKNKISAYIPISTGCNNFCSYCVVPYTRGREISRPAEEIISEVKDLVKKGYKEIMLLGQNVNSYGLTLNNTNNSLNTTKNNNFPELLKKINRIPGEFWIRFLTSHPKDFSDDLIDSISQCEKVTEYIHLPVQSGDDKIIRRMNRHYTRKHYLNLLGRIQTNLRIVSVSTDIIVGFPGETKKQFENTAELMKKVKFDMAYIACYSPRADTAAYKFKDNVSREEKNHRKKILNDILKKTALENNKKYIGKVNEVLVESCKENKKLGILFGHTRTFKPIQFYGPENIIGKFVKVKITNCTPWALEGKLIK